MSKTTRVIPAELAILPVRDTVLFPGAVMPLPVGRESSLALLDSLEGPEKLLGVVAQLDPRVETPTGADLHGVGTLAKVHKMVRMPNGNVVAFLEGLDRLRVLEVVGLKPFLRARVEVQPDIEGERDAELTALERNVQELFREVVARSPQLSDDLQTEAMNIDSPARLADFVSSTLPALNTMVRQELLETFNVRKRLETLVNELSKEKEVLELRNKIHEQVQEQVNQSQREFLLREQMKAIQKELGESDDSQTEVEELRKKVEESGMSAEAKKESERELKRLAKMTPASAEYMVSRTYLEWMTSLPWNKTSGTGEEQIDIAKAQEILDEDHYDLVKVKQRILDYLAVKKLQPGMKGPILCFVGPPGVGKTSLGKSIARAMGRKFVRISLGGMHDEAEIRGHRRTYIGALPGQIIQGIRARRDDGPRPDAGRGRQARARFPGRSVGGVDGSARPGAELDVPRSLSGCAVRSIEGSLRGDGELDGSDSRTAARPHGDPRTRRLHRGRKGPHCEAFPDPAADEGTRDHARRADRVHRRGAARSDSPLHAGSGRAESRTRNRHARSETGAATRRRQDGQTCRHARRGPRSARHSEVPPRKGSRGSRQETRRFGRTGLDAGRRRHRLHRGQQDARRKAVHDDRAPGRGDAGVHARGA